jgi:hypothetical protein
MDCLKSSEFPREDQDLGAEGGDQYRDDPNNQFGHSRIIAFDFSLCLFSICQWLINTSYKHDCQMMEELWQVQRSL